MEPESRASWNAEGDTEDLEGTETEKLEVGIPEPKCR